ncbi:hypothetical protein [Sulfuricurvum sp.]|uniref:hypothetical protein n=1 Tax=Sulfuricurvum sp. TaxID=2025608 RepID=UPI0026280936|nr:hypothetical protein [Sulfuricurvum sp.]MDD2267658.1 hypothetical protein [Sulfuricurvum sp.]MDD2784253.1 hypothetical protein [Sulfuricurvum sp.]
MALSKSEEQDYKLIGDAFARQSRYHAKWLRNDRYYHARYSEKQWNKLKKTKRSKLFIPVIRNIINITKSIFTTSFFSAGCPIEITYIGDSDKDKANVATTVVKYWYDKDKPYKKLARSFWSALTMGLGIVISYWDNDRIRTQDIFIKDIAFDYEATDIDDVQYLAYRFYESGNTIMDKIDRKFYKIKKKDFFGNNPEEKFSKRYKIEELIKRKGKKWSCRTFCDGKLMRETVFERNPFQYGYAIDEYKYQDIDLQKDQILVYGGTLVWMLKEIQDEINIKRNQKNDIQEEKINPTYFVGDGIKLNPFDLKKGPGSAIKFSGKITGDNFQQRQTPSEVSLDNDLAVLTKQDLEDSSGVNGIMRGGTSASDRRSAASLSIINANSSPRIEDMILLISDTLFHHWAKNFVYLAIKHTTDDLIHKLTERNDFPLGKYGKRELDDFNLSIKFGSSINKDAKINDLLSIVQMFLQNRDPNNLDETRFINEVTKQIVTLKLGENTKLFDMLSPTPQPPTNPGENPNESAEKPAEEGIDPQEEREKMLLAAGSA